MIATITKKAVRVADLPLLTRGTEVEVYPDIGSTLQVHYRDSEGTLHIAYNVQQQWFASVAVFRTARSLKL